MIYAINTKMPHNDWSKIYIYDADKLFFDLIAIYNGFKPIDYSVVSSEEYINASIECVQLADETKLFEIIFKGLQNDN